MLENTLQNFIITQIGNWLNHSSRITKETQVKQHKVGNKRHTVTTTATLTNTAKGLVHGHQLKMQWEI